MNSDAVSVWSLFAHESLTENRLARTNTLITHGTARQGMARKGKA